MFSVYSGVVNVFGYDLFCSVYIKVRELLEFPFTVKSVPTLNVVFQARIVDENITRNFKTVNIL